MRLRVIAVLERLFAAHGTPAVLRSDDGPEFIARALRIWALMRHSETATIEPGKPWQNGSVESFNGTFRAECLDAEWFAHLREARIVIEQWGWEYNTQRPHSSLGYRRPAEVGTEARAAMIQESRTIEIAALSASCAAVAERSEVEVNLSTLESLSLSVVRRMGTAQEHEDRTRRRPRTVPTTDSPGESGDVPDPLDRAWAQRRTR